jgi:hypothetical protein
MSEQSSGALRQSQPQIDDPRSVGFIPRPAIRSKSRVLRSCCDRTPQSSADPQLTERDSCLNLGRQGLADDHMTAVDNHSLFLQS